MPNNVYHYTDATALASILERKEIWLTDYRFLNDSSELELGVEKILNKLESKFDLSELDKEIPESPFAMLYLTIHMLSGKDPDSPSYFTCSFSEKGDLLSQWRAYGLYSIEFDLEKFDLSTQFSTREAFKVKCSYTEESHTDAVSNLLVELKTSMNSHPQYSKGKEAFINAIENSDRIPRFAFQIKHHSFEEEKEHRIVVCSPDPEKVNFRKKGDILIPYIKLKFPPDAIKKILIGPTKHKELSNISINQLVEKYDAIHDHEIDIKLSETPYREI